MQAPVSSTPAPAPVTGNHARPLPASIRKRLQAGFLAMLLGSASLMALVLPAMAQTGRHGATPLASDSARTQQAMKKGESGKGMNGFGRMFSLRQPGKRAMGGLSPQSSPVYDLRQLGNRMKEPASWEKDPDRVSVLPSGYVFLGQFIDHDITLDTVSRLDKPLRAGVLENHRTVALDLDNVYGGGPDRSSHLYNLPWLRIGKKIAGATAALPRHDLLRTTTGKGAGASGGGGTALIGDFRNDENYVLSQLQMAFVSFHNRIVNQLVEKDYGSRRAEFCGRVSACKTVEALVASRKFPASARGEIFEKARDHVIHYYHRVISEDFLPRVIGARRAADILSNGRNFYFPKGFVHSSGKLEQPFIPLEFAGAAYRYGHAQIRQSYRNHTGKGGELPLFRAGGGHGRGSRIAGFNVIRADRIIDWQFFFPLHAQAPDGFNFANKMTAFLPAHLHNLGRVGVTGNDVVSLAARNLNRGRIYRLPSGQDIAEIILPRLEQRGILKSWQAAGAAGQRRGKASWRSMIQKPDRLTIGALGNVKTPLWYYILQEASAFTVAGNETGGSGNDRNFLQSGQGNTARKGQPAFGLPASFYPVGKAGAAGRQSVAGMGSPGQGDDGMGQFNSIMNGNPAAGRSRSGARAMSRKAGVIDPVNVGGHTLGPVGGTIVGEVLMGLLEHYREKTGKGLDYTPALQPKATPGNRLDLSSRAARNFHARPLSATTALGIRYQMRNLVYDAGVGFPVTVRQSR